MFGFFGDLSIPSLILALKLFLNIQEKLKFCLEKRKKLTETFFSVSEKKTDQKIFPHLPYKCYVKLRIYSKT